MHLNHLCGHPQTIKHAVMSFSVGVFWCCIFKLSLLLSLPEVLLCSSCVLIGLITGSLIWSAGTYRCPLVAHSVWPAYFLHIIKSYRLEGTQTNIHLLSFTNIILHLKALLKVSYSFNCANILQCKRVLPIAICVIMVKICEWVQSFMGQYL